MFLRVYVPEENDFFVYDVISIGSREIIRKKRLFGNDIKSFRHSLFFFFLIQKLQTDVYIDFGLIVNYNGDEKRNSQ